MFDHILVPVDGSELSQRAVSVAVEFARKTGARMTVFYASTEPVLPHAIGFGSGGGEAGIVTPEQVAQDANRRAQEILAGC